MKISPEIKEFLDHAGKVLIFEEGEPVFVVAKFKEYMELARGHRSEPNAPKTSEQASEERNRQIQEVNRELEAIAQEDFFLPLAAADDHTRTSISQKFYREAE